MGQTQVTANEAKLEALIELEIEYQKEIAKHVDMIEKKCAEADEPEKVKQLVLLHLKAQVAERLAQKYSNN